MEDATAVLQLLKEDIPNRYPHIRFHIAHLGGDVPFLTQRIEDNFEDWSAFPHSPAQTLRIFMSPRCVWLRNITGPPKCWLDPITHISRRRSMCGV